MRVFQITILLDVLKFLLVVFLWDEFVRNERHLFCFFFQCPIECEIMLRLLHSLRQGSFKLVAILEQPLRLLAQPLLLIRLHLSHQSILDDLFDAIKFDFLLQWADKVQYMFTCLAILIQRSRIFQHLRDLRKVCDVILHFVLFLFYHCLSFLLVLHYIQIDDPLGATFITGQLL